MATEDGIRDRIVARWQNLNHGLTDRQIHMVLDFFLGARGARERMTEQLMGSLLYGVAVPDAWDDYTRATELTKAANEEVVNARLGAIQCPAEKIPRVPGLGLALAYLPEAKDDDFTYFPSLSNDPEQSWRATTLTNREACMIHAVEKLTNDKEWWIKCEDSEISNGWKQEMLGMDWPEVASLPHADFTPEMADAVIAELRVKAPVCERTGLVPVMDWSAAAIKSDTILTDKLLQALKEAVHPLEGALKEQESWTPKPNHQVFDLVDPALWPLVYGKTRFVPGKRVGVGDALKYSGTGVTIPKPLLIETPNAGHSNNFQWLPCDVNITPGGKASITSYINNLHPNRHAELYPVIESLIEKCLPAWDAIYQWPSKRDFSRIDALEAVWNCTTEDICGPHGKCFPTNRGRVAREGDGEPRSDDGDPKIPEVITTPSQTDIEWFVRTHKPLVDEPYPEEMLPRLTAADVRCSGFFDSASGIQVIVKLSNFHLSPDSPSYEGGSWQKNGIFNEHICATALHFYDSHNITDNELHFRTRGNDQDLRWHLRYKPRDFEPVKRVFAVPDFPLAVQNIGSVQTPCGRSLIFPNVYQHRFGPFRLVDPTRPGHCKVLALYLVDPKIPVISTAHVGPQQRQWWEEETSVGSGVLSRLPAELQKMVLDESDALMDLEEAKEVRAEISKERERMNERLNASIEREIIDLR